MSSPPQWNATLTERQRVLLHMQPLMTMRQAWLARDEDGQKYDPLCLCMKLFELAIDQSGFGNDVVRESVARELVPLLRSIDLGDGLEPDEERHQRIVDRLIGNLLNESNRGESFAIEYTDFDANGRSSRRSFAFKLLREVHGYSGEIALELSSEAINLFLNALDLDIESEQIANEAVVQWQLERGNFDKARSSAETARARSLQYEQKIHRVIEQAKRDIRRVNWREEVHATLLEANEHVDLRLRIEDDIIRSAREKLDSIAEDDENRLSLADVVRLMNDCISRHLRLSKRLMTARGEFIEQQSRQCFVDIDIAERIEMRDALLMPLLALPLASVVELTEGVGHTLVGPRPPRVLTLRELVEWQLHPKREHTIGEIPFEEMELVETNAEVMRLDDCVMVDSEKVFIELDKTVRLSKLLNQLESDGCPWAVQDAVTLQVLERFDPEDEDAAAPISVELAETAGLNGERCSGDDLLVIPLN